MNGRLESQLIISSKTEDILEDLPRFIFDWYYYLKANRNSATTCREYVRKARYFLSQISDDIELVSPEDITDAVVIKFFNNIQVKNVYKNGRLAKESTSDSYQQCMWSCLNNLFNYLYGQGKIEYNFITKIPIKRPKNQDLVRINRHRVLLTEDDFKSILNAVDTGAGSNKAKGYQNRFKERDKCMINLFMTTGMRKGALASINVDDIDMEQKKLVIIDKGAKVLEYDLSDMTMEFIDCWLSKRNAIAKSNTDALFVSKDGDRISLNGIDKIVAKYSKEAIGKEISPHKLRSGFISIIQSKTHDIEFTRRVVGHSNVSTTQRYIVTDNTERKKAGKMISDILA